MMLKRKIMVDRIFDNFINIAQADLMQSNSEVKPDKKLIERFERKLLTDSESNGGFIISKQIITPSNIKSEGGTVCDGKGGFKEIIDPNISDECGIRSCFIQHEQVHINQLKNYASNICEGQPEGTALGYIDNASAIKYERPAYKDTIQCLENKMDNASILCQAKLKLQEFQMPGAFNVLYREKLSKDD